MEYDSWDVIDIMERGSNGWEEDEDEDEERLLQEQLEAEIVNQGIGKPGRKRNRESIGRVRKRQKREDSPTVSKSEPDEIPFPDADVEEAKEEDIPESSGVPVEIMAERIVDKQVQLLVRWKGYPGETDWTWELESEFNGSVPKLVDTWRKKKLEVKDENEAVVEDIVEKILSKRKFKGVPHYLVKWKGYEETKDRTWEPCDRLAVDVPHVVEAYECKSKAKKK